MESMVFTVERKINLGQEPQIKRGARILIVEDDTTLRPLLEYIIARATVQSSVVWATTEEDAERTLSKAIRNHNNIDIVLADVFLSGQRTGLDLWSRYRHSKIPFVFMSAISNERFDTLIGNEGLIPIYLQKPIHAETLVEILRFYL